MGNPSDIANHNHAPPWPHGTPALGDGYSSGIQASWATSPKRSPWDPPSWGEAPKPPGRVAIGWSLSLSAIRLVRKAPSILLIPVITFVTTTGLTFLGTVLLLKLLPLAFSHGAHLMEALDATGGLLCLIGAVAAFSIGRAAIIWRSAAHLNGNACLNRGAYVNALARTPALLGWAFLSVTAGWMFQIASVQRNVRRLFGVFNPYLEAAGLVAWSSVTYLAIPVILFEHRGPVQAISRARSLARHRWGEQLVGRAGLGLLTLVFLILAGVSGLLFGEISIPLGLVVGVALAAGVMVVSFVAFCSLEAVFYHWAMTSPPSGPASPPWADPWKLWP